MTRADIAHHDIPLWISPGRERGETFRLRNKVESHHVGAAALHFESEAAVPGADIEDAFAAQIGRYVELSRVCFLDARRCGSPGRTSPFGEFDGVVEAEGLHFGDLLFCFLSDGFVSRLGHVASCYRVVNMNAFPMQAIHFVRDRGGSGRVVGRRRSIRLRALKLGRDRVNDRRSRHVPWPGDARRFDPYMETCWAAKL